MATKTLYFNHRGDFYEVNPKGWIERNSHGYFSSDWIFLGGSSHHWHNRPTVTLADAFKDPEKLNGCIGWDRDHGTVRSWNGKWAGRIPRIRNAHVREYPD